MLHRCVHARATPEHDVPSNDACGMHRGVSALRGLRGRKSYGRPVTLAPALQDGIHDVELRRISITNHGRETRSLDLTSYAEVVLAPPEADLAHPAFSNLFIETSARPDRDALICARRPRSGGPRAYLFHLLSGRGRVGPAVQFETNRARFVGRGRTLRAG